MDRNSGVESMNTIDFKKNETMTDSKESLRKDIRLQTIKFLAHGGSITKMLMSKENAKLIDLKRRRATGLGLELNSPIHPAGLNS